MQLATALIVVHCAQAQHMCNGTGLASWLRSLDSDVLAESDLKLKLDQWGCGIDSGPNNCSAQSCTHGAYKSSLMFDAAVDLLQSPRHDASGLEIGLALFKASLDEDFSQLQAAIDAALAKEKSS